MSCGSRTTGTSGAPQEPAGLRPANPSEPAAPRPSLFVGLIGLSTAAAFVGFLREVVIGAFFGASKATDVYFAALAVPFVASHVVVAGALVPPITAHLAALVARDEQADAARAVRRALAITLLGGGALVGLAEALAEPLAGLLAPGFSGQHASAMATQLRILLLFGLLASLSLMLNGVLTATGAYRRPVVAVLLGNVASVLWVLVAGNALGVSAASWGLVCGALVSLGVNASGLRGSGLPVTIRPAVPLTAAQQHLPGGRMALLAIALAAGGAIELAERFIASWSSAGSVSLLFFGSKLAQFPAKLVAIPIASVALPRLVNALERQGRELGAGAAQEVASSAKWILVLLGYGAAVAAGAAGPIAALTFGHGKFGPAEQEVLGIVLATFAPTVIAAGLVEYGTKIALATQRLRGLVAAQVAAMVTYLVLAPLLSRFGIQGLAAARTAAWCVAAAGLSVTLARVDKRLALGTQLVRLGCVCALVGYEAYLVERLAPGGPFLRVALTLAVTGPSYLALVRYALRLPTEALLPRPC
ncbi:MAG: hypothetical protein HYV63_27480 [Candidatus Schekmanbacteria bacterium]|nr:hypothetical protein [Candidatus Schekmanbacteria bacterium]